MSYIQAIKFFKENFGAQILPRIDNTIYSLDLIVAIAIKETGINWSLWIDKYPAETILQRCVFDASGDYPGTTRNAFPRNKAEFEQKYGTALTEELIKEANLARKMPHPNYPDGFSPANYLYKGYGIFQYDLQNIVTDESFFTEKKWYNMDDCLTRLIMILDEKKKISTDSKDLLKHYNGNGPKAEQYAEEAFAYMKLSASIV